MTTIIWFAYKDGQSKGPIRSDVKTEDMIAFSIDTIVAKEAEKLGLEWDVNVDSFIHHNTNPVRYQTYYQGTLREVYKQPT